MWVLLSLLTLVASQTGTGDGGTTTGPTCTKDSCVRPTVVCDVGQTPSDPTSPCNCPKCVPRNCTTCPTSTNLPACTPGSAAYTCNDCTNSSCCKRCVNQECPPCADTKTLPVCAGGVQPVGTASTTGSCAQCPTCRPDCSTTEAFAGCANALAVAPFCDGTNAGTGCCPGCRDPPPCTLDQIAKCTAAASLTNVPQCAAGTSPKLDPTTCCFNCKRPPEVGPCNDREAVAALVRNLRPCADGEPAVVLPGQCVKTCRQQGSECDPADIKSFASIQTCPDGVPPRWIGCTPTCLPQPPKCPNTCSTGTSCVRDAIDGTDCVPKTLCVELHAKGIDATANPTDVLRLIVQKHCEDIIAGGVACSLLGTRILDSVTCTRDGTTTKDPKTDRVYEDIKCCIAIDPNRNPAVGRRLLASGDTFNGATQNQGATGNVTFYVVDTGSAAVAAPALLGLSLALFL